METNETLATIGTLVVLLALVVGGSYGAYKYGRTVERRLLYDAMVSQIYGAYGDGYSDGFGRGRTKGWADAMKEVDTEPLFSGHY